VLGTLDDSYSEMISRVFGIVFLATPHRGSNYARTLNNILSASMITNAKVYVAELEAESTTLQSINEEFRLVCKPLRLVSFYESLKTQAGTHKILVRIWVVPQCCVVLTLTQGCWSRFWGPGIPVGVFLTYGCRPS